MSDDKDLPAFGAEVEPTLRRKLEAMREGIQKLMGLRGDRDRAAVRWADLKAGGLVNGSGGISAGGGSSAPAPAPAPAPSPGGGTYTPDLTKPPTPTGLVATATFSQVILSWDAPLYAAGHGQKQTNVYATKQPAGDPALYTINDAVRVDSATGPLTLRSIPSEPSTLWRVWIRFESNDGVESDPLGGVNGVTVTTSKVGDAVEPGTIDDVRVANLSAVKLTVGDGQVGGILKSTNYSAVLRTGWQIRPDGFAEFSDALVRGTIFASQGAIGGSFIGSNYIQSTNWENLTTGWRLSSDGTGQVGGIALLSTAIQSGNYTPAASGFALRSDGTGQIGGLKITNTTVESYNFAAGAIGMRVALNGDVEINNLTARGNITAKHLDAATGTFSGTMTAEAVNAVKTINLAGDAVLVPRRGAHWNGEGGFGVGDRVVFTLGPVDFSYGGKAVFFVRGYFRSSSRAHAGIYIVASNGVVVYDTGYLWAYGQGALQADPPSPAAPVDIPMFTVEWTPPNQNITFSIVQRNNGGFQLPEFFVEATLFGVKR